jgi:hypothetical protein
MRVRLRPLSVELAMLVADFYERGGVAVKDHPEQISLFEMYASPAAYEAHL